MRYLLLRYGEPVRPETLTGGYYLIGADSLDAAVESARRLRHDADGSIELRPLFELGVDSGPAGSS